MFTYQVVFQIKGENVSFSFLNQQLCFFNVFIFCCFIQRVTQFNHINKFLWIVNHLYQPRIGNIGHFTRFILPVTIRPKTQNSRHLRGWQTIFFPNANNFIRKRNVEFTPVLVEYLANIHLV